jgi:hypothetical protein
LSQPLIGSFTIPIGDLLHESAKDRELENISLEKILLELKKMIENAEEHKKGIEDKSHQVEVNKKVIDISKNYKAAIRISMKKKPELSEPLLGDDKEEKIPSGAKSITETAISGETSAKGLAQAKGLFIQGILKKAKITVSDQKKAEIEAQNNKLDELKNNREEDEDNMKKDKRF